MDASQPIYWEESPAGRRAPFESCNPHDETHRLKEENALYNGCDTNLNFSAATCSEDDYEYAGGGYKKSKSARQDPMSHRIIEKRRRDRMNNCLADLSRLIPAEYLKKGRGRIEKTEIIEMAIKHMKYLQREHGNPTDHYRLGYQECMSETMRFLVEIEGHFPREPFCLRLLNHLQAHCEHITHPSAFGGAGAPAPASRDPSAGDYPPSAMPQDRNNNESEAIATDGEYCKNAEASGGVSYKYKTNIKMRFSRDTNGTGRRIGSERRGSLNSVENRSSSYGSPPSGEPHTRASESDNAHGRSPSGSNSSVITPKLEPPANDSLQSHASVRSTSPPQAAKNPQVKRHSGSANAAPSSSERNFDVPIFALHTKRSHYVPLAVDYRTLAPYLGDGDLLEGVATDALHPVTINVRFAPSCRGFGDAGGKCRGYCDWT